MRKTFTQLLASAGLTVRHRTGEADVTDVTIDSRSVQAGSCFVAVRGASADGHRFIKSALAAGASAIVCETIDPVPPGVCCALVEDTRRVVGPLAQAMLDWPARALTVLGVTGTNGKSTVTYLLRAVLEAAGYPTGLLGTIEYCTGQASRPALNTTPDGVVLARMMADMVAAGQTHVVMEASSHALDQHRTAGIDFHVAAFTNLSGDHMDYHGTPEKYLRAKQRLFEALAADAHAVLNRDDPASEAISQACTAQVHWYGLSPLADLHSRIDRIDAAGSRFVMIRDERQVEVDTPLIGRHNVLNCLAAAASAEAIGIDLEVAARALSQVRRIPGRLERVAIDAPYQVFVDYAHTDDALGNVLRAMQPVKGQGRLIVVFGCGGDRDRTKRPRMAHVAEHLADRLVVTSDNPRSEDPAAIIDEIVAGLTDAARRAAIIEPDRGKAIELAVSLARAGDVVLIAGKGHENYQIVGDRRRHFDDVEVAAEAMHRHPGEKGGPP